MSHRNNDILPSGPQYPILIKYHTCLLNILPKSVIKRIFSHLNIQAIYNCGKLNSYLHTVAKRMVSENNSYNRMTLTCKAQVEMLDFIFLLKPQLEEITVICHDGAKQCSSGFQRKFIELLNTFGSGIWKLTFRNFDENQIINGILRSCKNLEDLTFYNCTLPKIYVKPTYLRNLYLIGCKVPNIENLCFAKSGGWLRNVYICGEEYPDMSKVEILCYIWKSNKGIKEFILDKFPIYFPPCPAETKETDVRMVSEEPCNILKPGSYGSCRDLRNRIRLTIRGPGVVDVAPLNYIFYAVPVEVFHATEVDLSKKRLTDLISISKISPNNNEIPPPVLKVVHLSNCSISQLDIFKLQAKFRSVKFLHT